MTKITRRPTTNSRRPWTTPTLERIGTGEAQLGANPVVGEGFFGKGS